MSPAEIEQLADQYKSAPTFKLVRLAEDPTGLPQEIILILQKELLERGEQTAALKLTEFLVALKEEVKPLSPEQARAEIIERLKAGESMESIALKFKENGLDVFEELNREVVFQENTFDYIASLRDKGLTDEALDQKLMSDLAMDQKEVDMLKEKMRKNGSANVTIGLAITIVTLALMILAGRFPIGGILLLGVGAWRIVEGQRMLSKA
ncbi:MAG TPA: hypothetical protein VGD65_24400 [Chryseosolibacter sp.]